MPVTAIFAGPEAEANWADLHYRLRAFVARRVADPHTADDLAQDILLRIHKHMGELRDEDRLDAWAYQVARRAIVDHYRSRASRRETPQSDVLERADRPGDDEPGDALEPESAQVRAEIAACLSPLVSRLPEPYRHAIELTDLGGLTQAAAAEQLQLSVPGMKARVQRGRQQLRDMLLDCCLLATDSRGSPTECESRGDGARGRGAAACAASPTRLSP